jgi:predicted TIM-barrel fold metal-dependent hydrolase
VRLTIQPFDGPDDPDAVARLIDHLQSDDMLLFSTDFPHWQFDGDDVMPAGIPQKLHGKIRRDNALATYGRLAEAAG